MGQLGKSAGAEVNDFVIGSKYSLAEGRKDRHEVAAETRLWAHGLLHVQGAGRGVGKQPDATKDSNGKEGKHCWSLGGAKGQARYVSCEEEKLL